SKRNIDAENSKMEAESAQDYFLLPIWSSYTSTVKSSEAKNEEELERLKSQEKEANDAVEALRKEFAQDTKDLLLQAGAARASITNTVNTASTPVSTASPSGRLSYTDLTKMILKYLLLRSRSSQRSKYGSYSRMEGMVTIKVGMVQVKQVLDDDVVSVKVWNFLLELCLYAPEKLRTSLGVPSNSPEWNPKKKKNFASTGLTSTPLFLPVPQQNEACHRDKVHPTEQLMVHRHDTSLSWIHKMYCEPYSALAEASRS
ncbi:hypothetical protein Tco_1410810, partial [Tanacetum coccineum]